MEPPINAIPCCPRLPLARDKVIVYFWNTSLLYPGTVVTDATVSPTDPDAMCLEVVFKNGKAFHWDDLRRKFVAPITEREYEVIASEGITLPAFHRIDVEWYLMA